MAFLLFMVVVGAVIWFDLRCLADLRATPDHRLRYFTRQGWMMIIIFAFPVGPMLYLFFAKDLATR